MALKPDRNHHEETDIRQYWSPAQDTAEKGGIASLVSQGSGVAMDSSELPAGSVRDATAGNENVVRYAADPSGAVPMGMLVQDVNPPCSATRDHKNFSNLEVRPGDKVTLYRKGILVTDMVLGTPAAGDIAYLGASGNVTPVLAVGAPIVGRFETSLDADGFARVSVHIA
jgi:hypothetical protein